MSQPLEIRVYGSLRNKVRSNQEIELNRPEDLPSVVARIGLSMSSIKLAMVNHRAVDPGHIVQPGDTVALFPSEYPFFADWRDFWPAS